MAKIRPATSGYARIAQAEDFSDEDDLGYDERAITHGSLQSADAPRYASITQPRSHGAMVAGGSSNPTNRRMKMKRRNRSNSSGIDIKAINARFERWADEIASKFKIGKSRSKTDRQERLEIQHSVFQAPEWIRPATAETLAVDGEDKQMTKEQFNQVIESVQLAIEQGVHPKMISQGSSGSYFARNTEGKTVGVFKPKDEEPYAAGNPKWNKWIHRNLFPCFFGRACLIPNLSYVSEAAAYTLDCRLRTNLVPYTDIVHLSSPSFHYDFWARRNFYRKKKPLPSKPGSFQVFLQGFSDANIFLRKHPWPDQLNSGFRPSDAPKKKVKPWGDSCRPSGIQSDDEDEDDGERAGTGTPSLEESQQRRFFWTNALQTSFREELEKLVILDYIMRNTDRGLDNWMIKVDWQSQAVSIVSDRPRLSSADDDRQGPRPVLQAENNGASDLLQTHPYKQQQPMDPSSRSGTPSNQSVPASPTISIGAIDNSLSWPWKHPDAWRSFPFGWLFLPVSLIGQPFSQKTREHFLPLLTSKQWWSETQVALREVFSQDADFQERMFDRQIAVMKGQAWNVVETLKTTDHGPLELTRRARVCVWDDLVDIPVAVPMRSSSPATHRRGAPPKRTSVDDEMDISAANNSAPQPDLLGFGNSHGDLPNPNRFDLSTTNSPRESEDTASMQALASPVDAIDLDKAGELFGSQERRSTDRPDIGRLGTRTSYHGPSRSLQQSTQKEPRRVSFSARRGSNAAMTYNGDDLEGDLGYAAAEDMEGNQRKVIVERLETVKSKNPVFTWC